jgi:hypothetical protein
MDILRNFSEKATMILKKTLYLSISANNFPFFALKSALFSSISSGHAHIRIFGSHPIQGGHLAELRLYG